MNALAAVIVKEVREALRDRRTLLTSLVLGPLLAPLFFMLILKLSLARSVDALDEAVPVTVAQAERAPNLVQHLRESGFALTLQDGDGDAIRGWLQADGDRVVLEVPEDYGARFRAGEPAALRIHADGSRSTAERHARRLRQALGQYGAGISALRLQARGIAPQVASPVVVHDIDVSTPSARATLLLGMLSYIILLVTLAGGLYLAIDATAGERERGSLEPLLAVPVPREQLIHGKILAAAAMMALALLLVTLATAAVIHQVPLESLGMSANFGPGVVWRLLLVVLPFTLLGAALLTVVAAFTRSYKEAQSWLGMVMLVPTVPIAIAGVLSVSPSAPLMLVPSLSQHLAIQALLRGEPLPAAWLALSVAGTLAAGLALAWLAGRLYRREAILG